MYVRHDRGQTLYQSASKRLQGGGECRERKREVGYKLIELTDKQTDMWTDTYRDKERDTERQANVDKKRQTETGTDTERHRERQTDRHSKRRTRSERNTSLEVV